VLLVSCDAHGSGAEGGGEPAIPRLSTWETNMTYYGQITCNNFVADELNSGTYYDGLRSMELIRAYRSAAGAGAPELATWAGCSDTANDVYRDGYVLANHGAVTGYNEFTNGMVLHYNRTAEANSSKAVAYMAGFHLVDSVGTGAAYCGQVDWQSAAVILQREIAYCMRSILDWSAMGGNAQTAKRDTIETNMKTQVARRIGTRADGTPQTLPSPEVASICAAGHPDADWYVQPFMLALQAHSFMQYYDQVGLDTTNILETVKWIADWLKTNAVGTDGKSFWYENCRDHDGTGWVVKAGAPELNLLFVDIYEWLYRKTCDPTYRDFADILFDEGVRLGSTFLGIDGKHFNQNYAQGSFDYVAMRQLTSPSCP